MKKEEKIELYNKANNRFGVMDQLDQTTEEAAELIVAINKYKRVKLRDEDLKQKPEVLYNLLEEIADVSIMTEALTYIFDKEAIEKIKKEKLTRLKNRLNKKDYYNKN